MSTSARARIAVTLADQAVSSASNFATGVVIARLSGAAQFGEYMLVLTLWLVVVGIHRVVITEPMLVTSPSEEDRRKLVARGVSAELLLGGAVSLFVAAAGALSVVGGLHVGTLLLALSPWFIPLLIQDFWRAMSFQDRRPGLALANDLLFVAVQFGFVAVFVAVGWRDPAYVIAAWGLGATAGALLGLKWFPASGSLPAGWSLARRLWPTSRWMLADFVTGYASDQGYLAFVALLLPSVEYGGFRAATSLMGPTVVILLAGGNIGLPEAARRADSARPGELRRFARQLTLGTFICIAGYGAVVTVGGRTILSAVYGPEFARFGSLATLVAVAYVVMVSVFGQGIALKAAGRMRRLWRVRILVAVASFTSVVLLVRWFGTSGAGWAAVATGACYAAGVYTVYRTELRTLPAGPAGDPESGPTIVAAMVPEPVVPEGSP